MAIEKPHHVQLANLCRSVNVFKRVFQLQIDLDWISDKNIKSLISAKFIGSISVLLVKFV